FYTVSLTAENPAGNDTETKNTYIEVYAPVTVEITSPADQARFETRTINILGVVNDASITEATITVNGSSSTTPVYDGSFNQQVNIFEGENTISVQAGNPAYSDSDTITVYGDIPQVDIRTKLTWDTIDDDFDSHLIWPQSEEYWTFYIYSPYDCYYGDDYPDWDESTDLSSGDPVLDIDDTNGYGPEYITLVDVPADGRYWFFVHYYSDDSPVEGATATAEIWINGQLAGTFSRLMQDNYIWECAYIDWADNSGTVHAGPEDAYYHEDDMLTYHGGGEWLPER
ncbi:hypothetical protein ACFLWJ_01670, partial [Chloroflexota bacterium]